jgi:hypothetical protein
MFHVRRSSRTVTKPGGLRLNDDARPGTASREYLLMAGILWMAGALYHLGFAAFHAFFWKLFRWKTSLRSATPLNRAVIQVLNLCLIYAFLAIAVFSAVRAVKPEAGSAAPFCVAGFWLLRAFYQPLFFGRKMSDRVIWTALFFAGAAIYSCIGFVSK